MFSRSALNLAVLFCTIAVGAAAAMGGSIDALRGTLVVAVPVTNGLVVCADKRLNNADARTLTDTAIKIRKVNDRALFAATNTVGFYDRNSNTMAFDAFDVVEKYSAKNDLDSGTLFWNGLKKEITSKLRSYLSGRPFAEWPETDRANNGLLFNLIVYSLRDNKPWSYSLKVFYRKARTPEIFIPDPVIEQVRTPKLSGKGRDVIGYLARHPELAADPMIQRFDESRFSAASTTVDDAVAFAGKLFTITNKGVPQANVSAAFDCAQLDFHSGFKWLRRG